MLRQNSETYQPESRACVVHGCFEKAVKWQLIARNPMDGIELPKPAKKVPGVVEKGGVAKLPERAQSTRLYPLILLGLASSTRRGGNSCRSNGTISISIVD